MDFSHSCPFIANCSHAKVTDSTKFSSAVKQKEKKYIFRRKIFRANYCTCSSLMPLKGHYQQSQEPTQHIQASVHQVDPSLVHNQAMQPDRNNVNNNLHCILTARIYLGISLGIPVCTCLGPFADQNISRMRICMEETTLEYHLSISK